MARIQLAGGRLLSEAVGVDGRLHLLVVEEYDVVA